MILFITHEDEVDRGGRITKWLVGPWNTPMKDVEFGVAELTKDEVVKNHYHEEVHEFLYLIEGKIEVTVNNDKRIVGKGALIYFEPKEVHSLFILSENAKIVAVKTPSRPKDKIYV